MNDSFHRGLREIRMIDATADEKSLMLARILAKPIPSALGTARKPVAVTFLMPKGPKGRSRRVKGGTAA